MAYARIDYLERCYLNLGLTPARSRSQAVFAYAAYRGLLQLAHEAPAALPAEWSTYAEVVRRALVPLAGPPGGARHASTARASGG